MRLIELRLKNLNSLKGEWHIDFADTAFTNEGIFAITGQTGAGKTTILDAICLALYGETPRINSISKSSNEVMTRQTAECFAEVVIDLNGNLYRCRWGQRRAYNKADGNLQDATHEIVKVHTDASKEDELLESTLKHTKNKIIELTRMDFQQFTRSILLAQGSFSAFLKAKADERADILEKITGTDIYATISAHVHEKKRTEEDILNQLQYGLEGLALLDIEEENQLTADLQSYQSAQSEQQQTIYALDKKIQWLDSVTESQEKTRIYQQNLDQALQAQQGFMPEAKRLAAANKALEIDSQYSQLLYSRDTLKRLQDEQQQISHTLPQQEDALKQATTHVKTAHTDEQAANEALNAALPKIKDARKLDADIAQQKYALQDHIKTKHDLLVNIECVRQEINGHEQQAAQHKNELARIEHYLDAAHELTDIGSDITSFENHCTRLKVLLEDNANLADNKASQQRALNQHQTNLDALYQAKDAKNTEIAAAQEKLATLQQAQAALTNKQSLAGMREEQEQIDGLSQHIEQIRVKRQQLDELHAQAKNIQTLLPAVQDDLLQLASLISDNESAIKANKDKRQDKQTHLYLLQKVAKLEDYIADLKDGHPCPLCGSLEHPYGTHHPHLTQETQTAQTQRQITALDLTIAELEKTLSDHRINQATKQSQLEQQQEQQRFLEQQIQKRQADLSDLVSLSLNRSYAQAVAALIQPLAQTQVLSLLDSIKTALTERRQLIKSTLSHYETLSDTLTVMRNKSEALEHAQYQLASDIKDMETNIKLNALTIEGINKKSADNFSELKALKDAVLQLLNQYLNSMAGKDASDVRQQSLHPLSQSIDHQTLLSDADAQASIDLLRQQHRALIELKNQFVVKKEAQQTLKATLGRLETQIETKQNLLDQHKEAFGQSEKSVADKTRALEQLQTDRTDIFADKDPEREESQLREALVQAQNAHISAQRRLDNTEHVLGQLIDKQKNVSDQLATVTATLNTQDDAFKSALTASDFRDESEFAAARMSADERTALTHQQQTINDALRQAEFLLKETQKILADKQTHPLTTEQRAALTEQHAQAQNAFNKRMELIGAISQRLKDNEDKKNTQQAQMDAINAQKQKLQVWQQLHKLIGSSDGKKYRTFAQGLTFDLMVRHANTQLQKMSDRYLLIRDDDSPLELNVIDNYQGGEIRSTKNLSGGEGFIISLALALGLSQMASQNIRVDSLFLDEGFGTLDEESLDIALDTLTSLQQEGKLIGVISHVQALKDRILTQIKVEKLSGGFSQITGQGCRRVTR